MNIQERTQLYHRVIDSATFGAVEEKAIEEQLELIEVLFEKLNIDELWEKVLSMIEPELAFSSYEVDKYIDEMADSIITMEQATGEYDLQNRIINRINFKLIKLEQRYIAGTLLDGLGYNN